MNSKSVTKTLTKPLNKKTKIEFQKENDKQKKNKGCVQK